MASMSYGHRLGIPVSPALSLGDSRSSSREQLVVHYAGLGYNTKGNSCVSNGCSWDYYQVCIIQ